MMNDDELKCDGLPEVTDFEACMTCLSDDAALLHAQNPEDEIADNMLLAETTKQPWPTRPEQ
jgi:hypothetical protein